MRRRRRLLAAAIVLILALFFIRPGVGRLRMRIVNSISLAVGRPVEVAAINLCLLPQPGFELQNFVVPEDPAFGTEYTLRADEVIATLRLSSLLRGRLEIAELSFTEPSLNLVRNSTGHWNLEPLLLRAQQIKVTPTGKSKRERPAFPYIEADRSRINFKFGAEKKPYVLTNADFTLWQDSENTWGMRLKAQPMRTDFNLSDTGVIRVEGIWQRAVTLGETPLQFNLDWSRAQLGQLGKLAYGRDPGWRGAMKTSVALRGTPADLNIESDASIDDFRRYDLSDDNALLLRAHCSARYRSATRALPALSCQAPVGGGFLTLEGSVGGASDVRNYDLALLAQDIPMQSLVALSRHAKKGIPADLAAAGALDASFKFQRSGSSQNELSWTGRGSAHGVRIASRLAKADVILDKIPFTFGVRRSVIDEDAREKNGSEPDLEVGPFSLVMGRPAAALVHGQLSRSGYSVGIIGEVQIQRLLQLARILGLPMLQPAADGIAKADLQLAGSWSAFASPQVSGKAQLRSVRVEVHGLNQPIEVTSANVSLTPGEVNVKNVLASFAGGSWRGSLVLPRQCAEPGTCPVLFDLHADTIATDQLGALLSSRGGQQRWYQFLSAAPQPGVPFLRTLRASGRLSANLVSIHKLRATEVVANAELTNGRLVLSNLRADLLGGRHSGDWAVDFGVKPPAYSGNGTFQGADLAQLAELMHNPWVSGSAEGSYRLATSGWTLPELIAAADATVDLGVSNGTLPHIAIAGSTGGMVVHRFDGRWALRGGTLQIQQGKLDTPGGIYQVSGTASLRQELNLRLAREAAPGFDITGTLAEPRVVQITPADTQAALKP